MNAFEKYNRLIAAGIMVLNLYFLPSSINLLVTEGGPWGFGLLLLPFMLPVNLMLIPAFMAFKKRYTEKYSLAIINTLALVWGILILIFLWT